MLEQIQLFNTASPTPPAAGGTRANDSGRAIEQAIADFLRQQGHAVRRHAPLGTNIYGGGLIADLYLPDKPLAIEIKWQDSRGSVDEKFPYLAENIRRAYPCPVVVVADGAGIRPGAIEWLRGQVDGRKLLGVYTLQEFFSYALRGL
jgi:hypothetical protein